MSTIIKILRGIAKSIGIFLFFFGIFALVQLTYTEKITAPDGALNNFIEESASQIFMEKCTAEGISEEQCQDNFKQAYQSIKLEINSSSSPIAKANFYSRKYVPYTYIAVILGVLLIFAGVGIHQKLFRIFGSESLSIGIFTLINLHISKAFLLPRLLASIPSDNIPIGNLIQSFLFKEVFPYQMFIAKIFVVSGIVLLAVYFVFQKFVFGKKNQVFK